MIKKGKTSIKDILLYPLKALIRGIFKLGYAIKGMTLRGILSGIAEFGKSVLRFVSKTGEKVEAAAILLFRLLIVLFYKFIQFTYSTGEFVIKYSRIVAKKSIKIIMLIPKSIVRDFSYWAPAFAVLGVVVVVYSMQFYSLALKVTVGGETIGYVSNESEFDALVSSVEDELGNTIGENYVMKASPTYSFAIVDKNKVSADDMYNDVYSAVCEEIGEHYGLYVDSKLIAATETREVLDIILNELKAPHVTGDPSESVEFVADVKIKKGIYKPSLFIGEEAIRSMFSTSTNPRYYVIQEDDYLSDICNATGLTKTQIYALNPELDERRLVPGRKVNISQPEVYLGIKIVKTISYTEAIEYDVKKINDSSLYKTQTKVKVSGQKGEKAITAQVTYIDGAQVSKTILSSTVTRQPVTREIYVGTKALPVTTSPLAGTGTFIRPISGGYTSCSYGGYRGHVGVDLTMSGAHGKPVYASASGTVISVGWSGGYGKCVKISHANGYTTWYAHMSAYNVSVGQTVYQGQQIGRIGSTGNSTGPHLHFELRKNGSPLNPMRYIG